MGRARLAQELVEVLLAQDVANARSAQYLIEALCPLPSQSPTSITGGGVSQYLIEALVSQDVAKTRVSQEIIEVLMAPNAAGGGGGTMGTSSWATIG